ncbi:hypothetical protein [Accumulibacter sp.]|uniref:hypothetical protein n=1 Tax=Accumulibacter sp. TaxID=2053492 RepID=UPI001AD5B53A|nr:hypothetical protein [Accumulibacter sp.]MBN8512676.1 hypothetical protein [Accumulibacter sp.]MBO3704643.1 hypothetical protein [Accumulibacter sp.]
MKSIDMLFMAWNLLKVPCGGGPTFAGGGYRVLLQGKVDRVNDEICLANCTSFDDLINNNVASTSAYSALQVSSAFGAEGLAAEWQTDANTGRPVDPGDRGIPDSGPGDGGGTAHHSPRRRPHPDSCSAAFLMRLLATAESRAKTLWWLKFAGSMAGRPSSPPLALMPHTPSLRGGEEPTRQSRGFALRVVDAADDSKTMELDCRVGCASSQ